MNQLPLLLSGASFLYVGGMFLNDAFDVEFDRQYRRERPIPSGAISQATVWRIGCALLIVGVITLFWLGPICGYLGLALSACIFVYDAIHKRTVLAPLLMALCRFWLYVIAASTGTEGVTGWSIWCGLALGAYIAGLTYLARIESAPGPLRHGPIVLLVVPVLLALIMNRGPYFQGALLLVAVAGLWIVRCLRYALSEIDKSIGRAVAGLLAGIVFVDWLAAADGPRELSFAFIALFFLALGFQKFVPAT